MPKKGQRMSKERREHLSRVMKARRQEQESFVVKEVPKAPYMVDWDAPKTHIPHPPLAYAIKEGDDIFVCFGFDGSLDRKRVSESLARKLLRDLSAILI